MPTNAIVQDEAHKSRLVHYPNGVPNMPIRETYTITVTDAASHHETRPVVIRLRTLLKLMLRGFGLRCVEIRPVVESSHPSEMRTPNVDH